MNGVPPVPAGKFNESCLPNNKVVNELMAEFVKNERVAKAQRARQRFGTLASSCLP